MSPPPTVLQAESSTPRTFRSHFQRLLSHMPPPDAEFWKDLDSGVFLWPVVDVPLPEKPTLLARELLLWTARDDRYLPSVQPVEGLSATLHPPPGFAYNLHGCQAWDKDSTPTETGSRVITYLLSETPVTFRSADGKQSSIDSNSVVKSRLSSTADLIGTMKGVFGRLLSDRANQEILDLQVQTDPLAATHYYIFKGTEILGVSTDLLTRISATGATRLKMDVMVVCCQPSVVERLGP
ncbi:uncharacterized protein MKK02DRAFT_38219 [Dioszegia hungarica]|uniref:Uncharacterized protein n=1 Tax=Dioszegia hungarica TaxID=4972 RepID=A0AA38H3K1_9TREE|nr:uncharacterized protein MKK02DRAFT_38219 [Dioszegia hungarica]KAI9633563.1 hypothetical protein MKK02DRAFT_38219 [Dioszegia hungarica]